MSALAPTGVIVLDLRRSDGGLGVLQSRNDVDVSILVAHKKYDRVAIRRRDA